MSKLTAALIAGFTAARKFASNVAIRVHAFLINLHVANLKAILARAEARVSRLTDMANFHKAAAFEATTLADEAQRAAESVESKVKQEAAAHGVTL